MRCWALILISCPRVAKRIRNEHFPRIPRSSRYFTALAVYCIRVPIHRFRDGLRDMDCTAAESVRSMRNVLLVPGHFMGGSSSADRRL